MNKAKGKAEKEKRSNSNIRWILSLFIFAFFASFTVGSYAQDLNAIAYAIQSGTSEQKRDALFQIRNIRSETASRLALPALKDIDEIVRATAASCVTYLPKAEAVNDLAPLLNDQAEFVRIETAYALGKVESRDAAAPLLRLLQKETVYEVRTAAVSALGSTGEAEAVAFLVSILKTKPKEDEEFLRRVAARSVGQIAQVIRTGNVYLVTPQNFLPDKYKDDAADEPESIAKKFPVFVNASATLSKVLSNKKETDDTRREAAFALGAIGDKSSVTALESYVNAPDYFLGEICKEALLKIKRSE